MTAYCLHKLDYQQWVDQVEDEIEINKSVMFPGKSMEVVQNSYVKELKTALGGRVCSEKEIIFVETVDRNGHFTFKHTMSRGAYAKCKFFSCGKVGLFKKVYCPCNEVFYCSEACRDKHSLHRDGCEVIKKRELDP